MTLTHTCSACGRPIAAKVVDVNAIDLMRRERQILKVLAAAGNRFTTISHLVDRLYGDDPDGGPRDAEGCVHTHVSKLKRKIKAHGYDIQSSRHEGYRLRTAPVRSEVH